MPKSARIAIIMGSDSDLSVMNQAKDVLEEFGIDYELTIVSAHRTPDRLMEFGKDAVKNGFEVIIAGAGGAAHLPGMVASLTPLPVVGVPIHSSNSLMGVDSLLSIVQMPGGVPVATVGVDNAKNAALLALRILSTHDKKVRSQMEAFMAAQTEKVMKKIDNL